MLLDGKSYRAMKTGCSFFDTYRCKYIYVFRARALVISSKFFFDLMEKRVGETEKRKEEKEKEERVVAFDPALFPSAATAHVIRIRATDSFKKRRERRKRETRRIGADNVDAT